MPRKPKLAMFSLILVRLLPLGIYLKNNDKRTEFSRRELSGSKL